MYKLQIRNSNMTIHRIYEVVICRRSFSHINTYSEYLSALSDLLITITKIDVDTANLNI